MKSEMLINGPETGNQVVHLKKAVEQRKSERRFDGNRLKANWSLTYLAG